jgi:hypothetical protein
VLRADPILTVIDVITLDMRVFRVIYNKRTTEPIAILVLEMAVVPVRPLQDTTDETLEMVVTSRFITAWFNA